MHVMNMSGKFNGKFNTETHIATSIQMRILLAFALSGVIVMAMVTVIALLRRATRDLQWLKLNVTSFSAVRSPLNKANI